MTSFLLASFIVFSPPPEAPPPEQDAKKAREEQIKNDPALHAEFKKHRRLIIAGAATGGAGVILGLSGGIWFIANLFAEGPLLTSDYVGPSVMWGLAGGAVVSGVTLLAVGGTRRAKMLKEPAKVQLAPSIGRHHTGASLTLRF